VKENTVLEVSQLKKRFKIYSNPFNILKEWITFGTRSYHRDFWALKGISFQISKGEFVGIIGPNGAGKSTLLRIITDVLRPTEGSYKVNGRVLSILELTGGTDKDLTGRENVIRTGQLMGFPDGYVQERMERIKEFSELGDFFEQPLRTYSTGMKTRLSFSMFAFMDTDVLILDEVLAVGDIFFKQKCFARLAELLEQKTTIILVTHSMGVIQRYCQRVILLNAGEKLFDGPPTDAIRLYLQVRGEQSADAIKRLMLDEEETGLENVFSQQATPKQIPSDLSANTENWPDDSAFTFNSFPKLIGKARASLLRLAVLNDNSEPTLVFKQGEHLHIYCEFQLKQDIDSPVITAEIRDKFSLLVHGKNSRQNHAQAPVSVPRGGIIRYYQNIALNIAPGSYVVNLECASLSQTDIQRLEQLDHPILAAEKKRVWRLDGAFAIALLSRHDKGAELPHSGLCDLPGEGRMQILPGGM
jgi:lipopolysaccharide transport system ATP-binding protein